MGLDLKYLLFLQGIRAVTGGIFDEIFNGLSKFAVDILTGAGLLLTAAAVIYII